MSAVVPFTFRDGEQLRTLPDGDSYWFVAADVAAIPVPAPVVAGVAS